MDFMKGEKIELFEKTVKGVKQPWFVSLKPADPFA